MEKTIRVIERGLELLAALVLAALLTVVSYSVCRRYLGFGGADGADELATWLYIHIIFIGFPLAAESALSMRLDFLVRKLRGLPLAAAELLSHAIVIHASLFLISAGLVVMSKLTGASMLLGWPEWCRFAPAPAAGALSCLLTLLRLAASGRRPVFIVTSLALGTLFFLFGRYGALPFGLMPSATASIIGLAGLFLGAPLPHALLSALALSIPFGSLLPEAAILQNTVVGASSFLLLAIPFFLLAGGLISSTSLAEKLVAFADALIGHLRGGLGYTALLSNLFFSGISGSSVADVAFGVKVLGPGLKERGYTPERTAAIIAATAMLPNIVPPSVAFLMLAAATDLSVKSLFMGGLAGGLALALAFAVALRHISSEQGRARPAPLREKARTFVAALPVLGLIVIILLGIRMGLVTTTEASALAALYSLAIAASWLRRRREHPRLLLQAFVLAGRETSAIGLLIGTSAPFVFILAQDQAPAAIASYMSALGNGPFAFLLLANLALILFGLCLEVGVGIMLLAPLLMPVAVQAGVDPIHFGVIMVMNLMLGSLTPPVGLLVFMAAGLSGVEADKVFRAALPLMGAALATLLALSVFAGFSAIYG
ncbi:MAG: TRAP transporter large permease subunit [Candidatus Accumulibacter sp.]|nr:TRAP transporter large permease subunit [Accumulibacter sp.]